MKCPKCEHSKSMVLESRKSPDQENLRKRHCLKCHVTFLTKEVLYEGSLSRSDRIKNKSYNNG
jgi:transcriptional regulator NrdR family protein